METVWAGSSQWQKKCETLVREGTALKVANIQTEEQRDFVRQLGLRFGASVAQADGVAYISPADPSPTKTSLSGASNPHSKLFLVIEDDLNDATLIARVFDSLNTCDAFVCRNLGEAKAYLQGAGIYSNRGKYPIPNGIICDLMLGQESGIDLIKWLETTEFKKMPVYILTGVDSPRELDAAKHSRAVAVLKKPNRYEDLKAMLSDLAAKLCS